MAKDNMNHGDEQIDSTYPFLPGDMVRMPQLLPDINVPVNNSSSIGYQQANDGQGGLGSLASAIRLGHSRAPEIPQGDSNHSFPPENKNPEGNTQEEAGQITMNPSKMFQESGWFRESGWGLTTQAELPTPKPLRFWIPTSAVNNVPQVPGTLDNHNSNQLSRQLMGSVEPISLENNAQPFLSGINVPVNNSSSIGYQQANDGQGGLGSLASAIRLGHSRAPEIPQADSNHSFPPENKNSEGNTQEEAGQITMNPSKMSRESGWFRESGWGLTTQAELLTPKPLRFWIPTSSVNNVRQVPGTLDNHNSIQLSQQLIGSVEPLSSENNAQPFLSGWGLTTQAELPTAKPLRSWIPTSSVDNVRQVPGTLDNHNSIQLSGQPMGSVEPISSENNAQPDLNPFSTGHAKRDISMPVYPVVWRNQPVEVPSKRYSPTFPNRIQPSLKRSAAEVSTPIPLVQQKKVRTTLRENPAGLVTLIRKPTGEQCFMSKRDLSFAPEGPIFQPVALPTVAILPCLHTFHDECLRKVFSGDNDGTPPCLLCGVKEA